MRLANMPMAKPLHSLADEDKNGPMAHITLASDPVSTVGELPKVGDTAPAFELVGTDLSTIALSDYAGKRVVLNIFPSLDTGICAMAIRKFNEMASGFGNTVVLAISKDLPFAAERFCSVEGIANVISASAFRSDFGDAYGITMTDGPLAGLLARSVVIIDESGKVIYTQLVPEIKTEPDYDAAAAALK